MLKRCINWRGKRNIYITIQRNKTRTVVTPVQMLSSCFPPSARCAEKKTVSTSRTGDSSSSKDVKLRARVERITQLTRRMFNRLGDYDYRTSFLADEIHRCVNNPLPSINGIFVRAKEEWPSHFST